MTLYDAYGRPVDTAQLREEQAGPTLAGVRNIYSVMHPSVGLTPEKLAAILQQAEFGDPFLYLELAEEMEEKDLHYLAVINTRKQTLAQLDIVVRPASPAREDVRIAEMASDILLSGALGLEDALFDILDAIGKGFSAVEIIWDTAGSQWIPRKLEWRDPRWFLFDWISGEQLLVRTLDSEQPIATPIDGAGYRHLEPRFAETKRSGHAGGWLAGFQPMTAPLAPFKFIVHFAKAKAGLPIRGGLARAAGWAYLFKNYVLKDWVTFSEVYGQPLRVGKYGAGATEADKRTLLRAVANIGTDAAAIIPESMIIEFTEARQQGSTDLYERLCEYIDRQLSKAVLGQTLTTDLPRASGSRAAAQVHDGVRRDLLGADARRLAATLTRDLIKPIVDLNLGPQPRYPQIQFALPDDQDAKTFADIIAELADRGLRVGQKAVLDKLGLPEPATGDMILTPAARAATANRSQS
jgi:phage gp29-like protein